MNSFRVYNIYLRYFRVIGFGDVRLFELAVCCLYFIEFEFFVIRNGVFIIICMMVVCVFYKIDREMFFLFLLFYLCFLLEVFF